MYRASDYRSMARRALKNFWWLAVGVTLLATVLGGGTSSLTVSFQNSDISRYYPEAMRRFTHVLVPVASVLAMGQFVLRGSISIGHDRFCLKLVDGEQAQFEDLFSAFDIFGNAFVLNLLITLKVFAWSLLFVIPGIIAAYRYSMATYIMAENPGLHEISLEPIDGWIELYPLESQGVNTVWRWGKQKSSENLNTNIKAKPMRNGSYMIVEKYREGRMMARSVWWDKDTNTEKGTLLVKDLMNGKVFDYPKPVELLMRAIEMGTETDAGDCVLDFFSGSATTAHAVMQLNAENGGNRKFIMVQLPEETDEKSEAYKAGYKNICEIGKERIRRAAKKIAEENPKAQFDGGFRVLKCDSSNMKEVYYNPAEYEPSLFSSLEDNIKEDRTPEDLLFQVMLDLGILLSSKIQVRSEKVGMRSYSYFDVEDGYLIACFDKNIDEEVITAIAKQKPYYFVMRDSSMANDSVATNFEQIFATYSPDTVRKVL